MALKSLPAVGLAALALVACAGCASTPDTPSATTSATAPTRFPGASDGAQPVPSDTAPKPTWSGPQAGTASAKPNAALSKEFCLPTEKLCFNHPEGWSFKVQTQKPQGKPVRDTATLLNAKGEPQLFLAAGVLLSGGDCDEKLRRPLYTVAALPTALTGYPTQGDMMVSTAHVSNTIIKNEDNTFSAAIFLTVAPAFAKVGESSNCGLADGELIPNRAGDGMIGTGASQNAAEKTKVPMETTYPSKDKAQAYFATPDAKVITSVLQSAHYK